MSNFVTVKNELLDIQEQKEKLLVNAGNKVASVMMQMNESGNSSVNSVVSDLNKLLQGFSEEDKFNILLRATAKIIVNL